MPVSRGPVAQTRQRRRPASVVADAQQWLQWEQPQRTTWRRRIESRLDCENGLGHVAPKDAGHRASERQLGLNGARISVAATDRLLLRVMLVRYVIWTVRGNHAWVLHATAEWSRAHLDDAPDVVGPFLLGAFNDLVSAGLPKVFHVATYRWRYATADPGLAVGALHDHARKISVCGDWCSGPRIENAYLSGLAAAIP